MDSTSIDDVEIVFKLLEEVKDEAQKKGLNKLVVTTLRKFNSDYLRKCTEYVYRDILNEVTILTKYPEKRQKKWGLNRKDDEATEKIIAKDHGKTYAELLKSVKDKVDVNKSGITMERIKITKCGQTQGPN